MLNEAAPPHDVGAGIYVEPEEAIRGTVVRIFN